MEVLRRAYQNQIAIDRPWVEMPNGEKNPAQIFRVPFVYKLDKSDLGEKMDSARERMEADIERALVDGVPQVFGTPPLQATTLGGVRHWLGRDLEADDEIGVAVLFPLTLRIAVGEHDLFNDHIQHGEWITEVSLWVKAAPAVDEKE
jgi:hypothetical protein